MSSYNRKPFETQMRLHAVGTNKKLFTYGKDRHGKIAAAANALIDIATNKLVSSY